ncbi:hypothetical protein FRC08_002435 [Ceratobasidium sp. 394]|nr:hypothetical protein FRC08_002435 [Ceratobasidium sp. 394]KAG9097932.1 hypothetical protein FS749_005078 [Ceratobasidium sp. UAMH 11750]
MVSGAQSFKDTGQIGPKISNGQMLEWRSSDGDVSRRPPVSFTKNPDSEGNVNYYRPIPDTEEASVVWRRDIGTYVAKELGYPAGKVYWMKGWPSGYGFYDHQKGKLPNPRHDLYLCGSASTVRFRSKNEFLPHALWLMSDPALKAICSCKYCTKTKSQVEVNQTLGLPGLKHGPESHSRAPTRAKVVAPGLTHADRRAAREKMGRDKAEKNKPVKRVDQPLAALPERIRDLASSGRTFRGLELVWVALKNPIYLNPGKSVAIDFWPAIILSFSAKNTPSNHKPGDPNYTIECRYVYTVRLLAVNHEIRVYEERLLPQLGYAPNPELLNIVKDSEPSRPLDPTFDEYKNFNPLPEFNKDLGISPSQYSFQDAAPAYFLALHIVACLTPMWCATHSFTSDEPKSDDEEYYQGLWWGAERIWVDDLIRLRPSREELDPGDTMGLLPPSSSKALERALLLRITYIVTDPRDPAGMGVCVGGDLYELALESEVPKSKVQPTPGPSSIFGAPTGLLGGPAVTQSNVASSSRSQFPFLNNVNPERDTFAQDQRSHGLAPAQLGSGSGSSSTTMPPMAEAAVTMPEPPAGYVFRRLLQPGNEMFVDVGAIAGRYYPSILNMETVDNVMRFVNEVYNQAKRRKTMGDDRRPAHTAGTVEAYADSRLTRCTDNPEEEIYEGAGKELADLMSLIGLVPGDGNAMEPEQWTNGRLGTITGAEVNGRKILYEQWKSMAAGASSDVEMIDG